LAWRVIEQAVHDPQKLLVVPAVAQQKSSTCGYHGAFFSVFWRIHNIFYWNFNIIPAEKRGEVCIKTLIIVIPVF